MDWLRSNRTTRTSPGVRQPRLGQLLQRRHRQPARRHEPGQPAEQQPLLDYLAQGFIEHDFDMKWLHREICNSRTYQRRWQTERDQRQGRAELQPARCPRRLPAEVAVDAVQQAIAVGRHGRDVIARSSKGRAIAVAGASAGSGQRQRHAATTASPCKSSAAAIRESNCDCDRSMEASLLQTVYLQNDSAVHLRRSSRTAAPGSRRSPNRRPATLRLAAAASASNLGAR